MRESQIESKVCKFAENRGWLCYKWASPGNRGVPDRLFFRDGITLAVEFKQERQIPTVQQTFNLRKLHLSGIRVAVVDSVEQGHKLFCKMDQDVCVH